MLDGGGGPDTLYMCTVPPLDKTHQCHLAMERQNMGKQLFKSGDSAWRPDGALRLRTIWKHTYSL